MLILLNELYKSNIHFSLSQYVKNRYKMRHITL